MELNETLKELRKKKSLTQQECADNLGINLSSYQKYERSANTVTPSIEALIKIADYYEVSLDYLLGREEKPNPLALLNISFEEDKFIEKYRKLPQAYKEVLADIIERLAK